MLIVFTFGGWLLASSRSTETQKPGTTDKGGRITMRTHYMGRFALDVPLDMKQAVQASTFRGYEIKEFPPNTMNGGKTREAIWSKHKAEITILEKPENVKKIIMDERHLDIGHNWARGVFYYANYISNRKGTWDIFVDAGNTGIWFKYSGLVTAKEEMLNWVIGTAKAYTSTGPRNRTSFPGNWFYLRHGAIDLPYFAQENTYSRFEGHPLDLKLEVEMNETHEVAELSVAERLAASIATRFAPGVDVERIRSRNRVAAGLKGEELVMRMSASGEDTQIQFGWEYRGKADSGEHPEIQITMETPDGNLDEKLKIWDAIIDSFKPMYR
jgi:hypothetical protein